MRIAVFRDMKEESWRSMEIYPDELVSALWRLGKSDLHIREFAVGQPVLPRWLRAIPKVNSVISHRYVARFLSYPLHARGKQEQVNHIVDHSYGHLAYFLDSKRTVVTCHDVAPLTAPGHRHNSLEFRLWLWAVRGLRRAHRIVAVSSFTKGEISSRLGVDPQRVRIVYPGVSDGFMPRRDNEYLTRLRERLGLPPQPLVLHVGSCDPRKNVETLIQACAVLASHTEDSPVLLQVGGSFSTSQRDLVASCGLAGRVFQIPQVSRDDLVGLYNLAAVLAVPSLYEGFGSPALEAMACGTPVIASNRTSLPEVVADAGIVVDPLDVYAMGKGLAQLLTDAELRSHYVEAGLERARKFSWDRTAQATYEVYQEVAVG